MIGYSLGGIIARAVLEHLPELKDKFKLLITFSSPHLGLASSENSLVRMGIWFMVKFQKAAMIGDMNGSE
jgi:pimeloyl-ACP methyl ester carboxylesterase